MLAGIPAPNRSLAQCLLRYRRGCLSICGKASVRPLLAVCTGAAVLKKTADKSAYLKAYPEPKCQGFAKMLR